MSDKYIIMEDAHFFSSTGISQELDDINIDYNSLHVEGDHDKSISIETEEQQNMIVTEYKTLLDERGIVEASKFILKRCIENLDPALQQKWNRIADEALEYLSSTKGESYFLLYNDVTFCVN